MRVNTSGKGYDWDTVLQGARVPQLAVPCLMDTMSTFSVPSECLIFGKQDGVELLEPPFSHGWF